MTPLLKANEIAALCMDGFRVLLQGIPMGPAEPSDGKYPIREGHTANRKCGYATFPVTFGNLVRERLEFTTSDLALPSSVFYERILQKKVKAAARRILAHPLAPNERLVFAELTLPEPECATMLARMTDLVGVSLRLIRQYYLNEDMMVTFMDLLYGVEPRKEPTELQSLMAECRTAASMLQTISLAHEESCRDVNILSNRLEEARRAQERSALRLAAHLTKPTTVIWDMEPPAGTDLTQARSNGSAT